MQLKQLQFFVVSVDMGSFKAAAEALYTSQPHVSKTIKALEEELNMCLLDRRANGVGMTEQGRKVYEYAVDILRSSEKIGSLKEEQEINQFSVFTNFGCQISELYVEFYRKYRGKGIRFQFREGTMEEGVRYLHRHMAEIGVVCVSGHQYSALQDMLRHKRLTFHLLKKAPLYLFLGPLHPLYHETSVSIQQLRRLSLIQPREDFFSYTNFLGYVKNDMRTFKDSQKIVTADSSYEILQFLRETRLAYVAGNLIPGQFERFQIHSIPIEYGKESVYYGYIIRQNAKLSFPGEEFIRFLRDRQNIKEANKNKKNIKCCLTETIS